MGRMSFLGFAVVCHSAQEGGETDTWIEGVAVYPTAGEAQTARDRAQAHADIDADLYPAEKRTFVLAHLDQVGAP